MKKEQSLAGVIRERLESIEARLAVGIRQEVLLAELAEAGYETSLSNFRNELWRARKRRDKIKEITNTPNVEKSTTSLGSNKAAEQPVASPQTATGNVTEVGKFEIEKPKKFVHNPNADKDNLF